MREGVVHAVNDVQALELLMRAGTGRAAYTVWLPGGPLLLKLARARVHAGIIDLSPTHRGAKP